MWSDKPPSKRTLDSLDAIIVQAESFADDLRNLHYRGKIEVIPYVPPVMSPAAAMPEGDVIRIGFLGRLVPQKNVAHLLKAFALLDPITSTGFSREFHIYGDGCEKAELEKLTLSLRIRDRVHFHGSVPAEMVSAAIDRCHLFAFSSLSEGQCLAALEILSRGRPIVATPVGAFPEILTTRVLGEISSLRDAQEFASALDRLGAEIATGRITPQAVQRDFGQIFARADVLRKYRAVLSAVEAVLPSHGHGSTALEPKPVAEAKHERWSA
jgi:glycosyltransferase involved in cell wall biosynthesis